MARRAAAVNVISVRPSAASIKIEKVLPALFCRFWGRKVPEESAAFGTVGIEDTTIHPLLRVLQPASANAKEANAGLSSKNEASRMTKSTATPARIFNDSFASWTATLASTCGAGDVEIDELIGMISPWVLDAETLICSVGLRELAHEGPKLQALFNLALDSIETCSARRGFRFAELLIHLDPLEDLLAGLSLMANEIKKPSRGTSANDNKGIL